MARAIAALGSADFEEAAGWAQRRFDLANEITDPDHIAEMLETAHATASALGRFGEARRMATEHLERSSRLTPHHRVHGISMVVEGEDLAGGWDAILRATPTVEALVADNVDTPCTRNARSILLCAVAHAVAGDERRSGELELTADGFEMYSPALTSPRIRLAIVRTDLPEVERLLTVGEAAPPWASVAYLSACLDGLALLRDRDRAEVEAQPLAGRRSYLQPFALRALGIVRNDDELLARADEGFAVFGLEWHREQTKVLLSV
jgi:hypothetical protein